MTSTSRLPRAFWWAAAAALVWNLAGLAAFVTQVIVPDIGLAGLPDEQRALYDAVPWWATLAFAVATAGGTLGAVGLLLRRRWAVGAFAASLVGIVVQQVHMFAISRVQDVMGWGAVGFPLAVLAIGVVLLVWSRRLAARGVLR